MLKTMNFIFGLLKRLLLKTRSLTVILLSLLIFTAPQVFAQEKPGDEPQPSLELILFLATFEDQDVGWVDPLALMATAEETLQPAEKEEVEDEK
ncbi:MAG: hypothetical protein C0622_07240 [Desulfuromonas sp.]|nr:MAG: hypothetical protein C0622_07240 [Desulfuromonas sp.]